MLFLEDADDGRGCRGDGSRGDPACGGLLGMGDGSLACVPDAAARRRRGAGAVRRGALVRDGKRLELFAKIRVLDFPGNRCRASRQEAGMGRPRRRRPAAARRVRAEGRGAGWVRRVQVWAGAGTSGGGVDARRRDGRLARRCGPGRARRSRCAPARPAGRPWASVLDEPARPRPEQAVEDDGREKAIEFEVSHGSNLSS